MRYDSMFLILVLLGATLCNAIGVVWTRHQSRALFVRLTQLQKQRDALNIEYGRLQLEQATWADPQRIAQEARHLGMVMPQPRHIQLVIQ